MSIAQNIVLVQQKIENAAQKAGVSADCIQLIAVTKTVDEERIMQAYHKGLRHFGENRVQEFLRKKEILPKDIAWNLIGQLQTNKVRYIIDDNLVLVHSLDRLELANELQKECLKKDAYVQALVQLNISNEASKSGLHEHEIEDFFCRVQALDRIRIRGFMTIGPNTDDEKEIRGVFAKTWRVFDTYRSGKAGFDILSMGMSGDYEAAIAEGANMVRVGSAIFGDRD